MSQRLFPVVLSAPGPILQSDAALRPLLLPRGPLEPPSMVMAPAPAPPADAAATALVRRARLTPLALFEHALATRQLGRAARLLTRACDHVGGPQVRPPGRPTQIVRACA